MELIRTYAMVLEMNFSEGCPHLKGITHTASLTNHTSRCRAGGSFRKNLPMRRLNRSNTECTSTSRCETGLFARAV